MLTVVSEEDLMRCPSNNAWGKCVWVGSPALTVTPCHGFCATANRSHSYTTSSKDATSWENNMTELDSRVRWQSHMKELKESQ